MTSRQRPARQLVVLPSGTTLEVSLQLNDTRTDSLAICLHPWSWLGGRMEDPVLALLAGPLKDAGFHVLRYNSRGVGRSTGWRSFTGNAEAQDLQELTRWALDSVEGVKHVLFLGYSYGSLIASRHPPLPAPIRTSYALISYPLGTRALLTLFGTSKYDKALMDILRPASSPSSNANASLTRPSMFVAFGDEDNFTSCDSYDAWAEGLKAAASEHTADSPEPLEIVRVVGGSHFWRGADGQELETAMRQWLANTTASGGNHTVSL